nr:MAG: hypothetical protein [Microvirus sp.]
MRRRIPFVSLAVLQECYCQSRSPLVPRFKALMLYRALSGALLP